METTADRYRRRARAFADVIAAVPADRWTSPSPCEGWTAREVVRHVVDTQGMFLGFVGEEPRPRPDVDDDPLGAFLAATGQVQDRLDDPVASQATFEGMFGTQTITSAVDRFLSFDLVVHRWDVARATRGDDSIDDAEAAELLAAAESFGDAMRGPGAFGPEREVDAGAPPADRLLAYLGRQP